MIKTNEKFTVFGSKNLENRIRQIMIEVTERISLVVDSKSYHALFLIGGYGRGEGGVSIENGVESPHNNFDLLFVTKKIFSSHDVGILEKIKIEIDAIACKFNVTFDVSSIPYLKLRTAQNLVIWYDAQNGHKKLLGDNDVFEKMNQFKMEHIPDWDITNLLVNRGALLVVNDLFKNKYSNNFNGNKDVQKLIIRHINKSIIGYGDALLYYNKKYTWSYQKKQKKMLSLDQRFDGFKKKYDKAMNFRFLPKYQDFDGVDLAAWDGCLRKDLEEIHLFCEKKRLKLTNLSWDEYPHYVFIKVLRDSVSSFKSIIVAVRNYLTAKNGICNVPWKVNLGFRVSSHHDILTAFFPVVAYSKGSNQLKEVMKEVFHAKSIDILDLKVSYLKYWSLWGDGNFKSLLAKYNIELNDDESGV